MRLELPKQVIEILTKFKDAGYEIYIVGGAVRDLITGRSVDDWDFTTSATPDEIQKLLPDSFYNNAFGTVGVKYDDFENPFEITTFRTDHGYSDSRRPDKVVWGKSLSEDMKRRDFTINSMALQLKDTEYRTKHTTHKNNNMNLIDHFDGKTDLDNKLIRAVGDPSKRFSEDSLRMMRAVRVASELGFKIEDKTAKAIKKK